MDDVFFWLGWLFLAASAFFFVAGVVGLVRFPDLHCRLHAVTKADTLGVGLLVVGLSLHIREWHPVVMMVLIWLLVIASSATSCQLLARYEHEEEGQGDHDGG